MSYKRHKKHSPTLKRFQTNSRPASPAPLGTAVTSASVQSLPSEQLGLAPSSSPQVSMGPDVVRSPHRPWYKRFSSRSGSPARRYDLPSKLTQSQAELGQVQLAPATSAEDINSPGVAQIAPNEKPTGRNNHATDAGATSPEADKEARRINATAQQDDMPLTLPQSHFELGQVQCASAIGAEDIPGPRVDEMPTGRNNHAAGATSPDVDIETKRTKAAIAWAGVKDSLRIVVRVSDVFPPLKSATEGVLAVIERFEVSQN
ncbi:hypothetical protein BDQ12DRAFT_760441 [Crucibulum laeve]|uniref:Uncharacterized protein n=1 Tax=Crucibulum laeve TaxID=68775 RepID=A0A5C3LE21_9AGAR|nr:hypothetical protein BDQ12DRAFT_760441 [Crucibulum laeve]